MNAPKTPEERAKALLAWLLSTHWSKGAEEHAAAAIRAAVEQERAEWREAVRGAGLMLSPDSDNPAWAPLRKKLEQAK